MIASLDRYCESEITSLNILPNVLYFPRLIYLRTMGSTFVAYICALLAYLYLEFTKPGYNQGGSFTPVVMAFAFLIGLQVCQIFMTPIGSGVDTIFVAAAWDPDVLMRDHPDLYQRMVRVYPKVQQMIHT